MPETVLMQKPKAMPSEIADERMRLVKSWATVEITDRQGEKLKIHPYFDKIMPSLMDRGGNITLGHTDQNIGKTLNYGFTTNPENNSEGMWILWKMHDHYSTDDKIWDEIKNGKLYALSFKGAGVDTFDMNTMGTEEVVKILEGYSFALCGEPLNPPANPGAIHQEINYKAKTVDPNMKEIKLMVDVSKPFAGYSNFDSCVKENSDKENPEAYCASIMHQAEGKECKKDAKTDGLNLISEENDNNNNNNNGGIHMDEPKSEVKDYVTKEEFSKMDEKINSLSTSLNGLTEAIKALTPATKQEDKKPEDDEDVKEKKKTEETAKLIEKTIDERMKEIVKNLGLTSSTPRPIAPAPTGTQGTRNILKELEDLGQTPYEEMRDVAKAIAQRERDQRMAESL